MNTVIGSTYAVSVKHPRARKAIKTLAISSKDDYTGKEYCFEMYCVSHRTLFVPKFFGIRCFGRAQRDRRSTGLKCSALDLFNGTLRNTVAYPQQEAHDAVVKQLVSLGGATLSLPCGLGKTVVALRIAATMQRKTLVVVHKSFLIDQWRTSIAKFVPNATVGLIRGPKCQVEDCDIVIAMLQTLSSRGLSKKISYTFGLVIVDEAHHVCAPVFSRITPLFWSRYILALSATPRRRDGLERILYWTCGPIAFEAEREPVSGHAIMVTVPHVNPIIHMTFRKRPNCMRMLSDLADNHERNMIIVNAIRTCRAENRCIIVLSELRRHLKMLDDLLACPVIYLIGGQKKKKKKTATPPAPAAVYLATYAFSSEGLDLPQLNTLILATPRSNIKQSLGRIMRRPDHAIQPLVIDLVERYSLFLHESYKRRHIYKKAGLDVVVTTPSKLQHVLDGAEDVSPTPKVLDQPPSDASDGRERVVFL